MLTNQEQIHSLQKIAKVIAILLILMVFIAPFSMLYLPSVLVVPGDATTTAQNVINSEGLFRLGLVSDSVVFLMELVLTALLYVLLKPVNQTFSLVAATARLAMTIIQGMNLLNYFFILLFVNGTSYLTAFTPEQLHGLVLLFFNAHENVVLIWGLAFSLHLFVLGYLVYKADYIPSPIGILLIVASLCYLIQSFGNILFPQYKELFASIGFLSIVEIAFPLWLLFKGIKQSS